MAKKTFDYFDMFVQMGEISKEAAIFLHESLKDYKNDEESLKKMHEIEHLGDRLHHKLDDEINRSFITPIEREDIIDLGNAIDDFTDSLEDVIVKLYMLNIETLRPEALEFCDIILESSEKAILALTELKNLKKTNNINDAIVEINNCEEKGDRIFHRAVRRLFTESVNDPVELIRWREIFDMLEACLDAVENLGDIIGAVVVKNS